MSLSLTELADLDRELAEGPGLVEDAAFGACLGLVFGWFTSSRSASGKQSGQPLYVSATQGALGGVVAALLVYGWSSYQSVREHQKLEGEEV